MSAPAYAAYTHAMARSREHLEELLKLPLDERSAAAEALLESLDQAEVDPDAEEVWAAEIQRRIERNADGISADDVFAEGRARLKSER